MKPTILKFSLLLISLSFFSCTEYFYKKANKEFANLEYNKAINDYKKVIDRSGNRDALIKLANSYRLVNDIDNAEKYYKEVVFYPESSPTNMFYYGKILMEKHKYTDAKIWFKKYLEIIPNDEAAQMLLISCDSEDEFMKDTTLYTLKQVEFPDMQSAFGQVTYKNGIVFAANKKVDAPSKKENWTGNSYYDLYFSEKDKNGKWKVPEPLKGEVNGRFHEGSATFNKAGDIVYFTRSNYHKYELKKNIKNESNLKLFKAKLENDNWVNLEEMPFNSDDYSVGQPSLAKDDKTLYFVSDMPGGFGGTDIYKTVLEGNTWSKPQNLGNEINTNGNEMFPYLSEEGALYFSSDAHNNMGGLDIFTSTYDEKNNVWKKVENLNYPLNSTKDDFGFIFTGDNKSGYISSNRNEDDKIFEFQKHSPVCWMKGNVKSKVSNKPLANASVDLFDEKSHKTTVATDKNGDYKVKLKPNSRYNVFCTNKYFYSQNKKISIEDVEKTQIVEMNFDLDSIMVDKTIPVMLGNIYYDLNKWNIRKDAAVELDKIVHFLNQNPSISIEVGSHTDSRDNDNHNLELSKKRAETVVKYFIKNGIDSNRLSYKGYGETKLINKCTNGVECSETDHQQNRRTEFKVTKNTLN